MGRLVVDDDTSAMARAASYALAKLVAPDSSISMDQLSFVGVFMGAGQPVDPKITNPYII